MEQKEIMEPSRSYKERVAVAEDTVDLSGDFLLPEQFDDAKRIIRAEGTLRPGGRYISGREAEYEGEMVYSVLYLTDSNSIKNAVFKTKYNKSITLPENVEDNFSVYPTFTGVECKLVNPRKMNLRSLVKLNFEAYITVSAAPEFSGDTPIEDSLSCEMKSETVEYLRTLTLNSRDNRVSRDFELESGEKSVKEIISCTMTVKPVEYTVSGGNVSASAEGHFKVIYLVKNDEDVEYACVTRVFKLDTRFSDEAIEEEYEGLIEYYVKEISVSVSKDKDNENRYFEVDFTYDACGRLYAGGSCALVCDVYSCDYECEHSFRDIELMTYLGAKDRKESFDCTVDCPHTLSILSPDAQIKEVRAKQDGENGTVLVDLDICVNALLRGEDSRLSAFTHEIPVRVSFDGIYADIVNIKTLPGELKAELKGDQLVISYAVDVTLLMFDKATRKAVAHVTLKKDSPREDASGLPITFYYPEEGEQLWDIAKKYGSTVEVIMSANELTSEKIGKNVLLIPKKRRRPLFSRVITK